MDRDADNGCLLWLDQPELAAFWVDARNDRDVPNTSSLPEHGSEIVADEHIIIVRQIGTNEVRVVATKYFRRTVEELHQRYVVSSEERCQRRFLGLGVDTPVCFLIASHCPRIHCSMRRRNYET